MGTNLSGNRIKDSYSGLLKTTDNTILTAKSSGYHVISDGAGNDTRLSLATDATQLDASSDGLVITGLATTSESSSLVISSSGVISKRAFPGSSGVSVTPAAGNANGSDFGTDPTVAIQGTAGGDGATLTFTGGNGINAHIDTSSDTITIEKGFETITNITSTSDVTLTADRNASTGANRTYYLDLNAMGASQVEINLPAGAAANVGMFFKFVIKTPKGGTVHRIRATSSGFFCGKAIVRADNSDDAEQSSRVHTVPLSVTTNDVIELDAANGGKGGEIGDTIMCTLIATNTWLVNADLTSDTDLTTPAVFVNA